ncbi:hypothetical protein D3C81_1744960 [compost metagenome]
MLHQRPMFQIATGQIGPCSVDASSDAARAMFTAVMTDKILSTRQRLTIGNLLRIASGDLVPDAPDRRFRRAAE